MHERLRIAIRTDAVSTEPAVTGDGNEVALAEGIIDGVTDLLDSLGIPGAVTASSVRVPARSESFALPIDLRVNGQICSYPSDLVKQVNAYHGTGGRSATYTDEWTQLLCLEAVKLQPDVLLTPAQAAIYVSMLPSCSEVGTTWPPDAHWVMVALCGVLRMRISIGNWETVAPILTKAWDAGQDAEEAAEDLLSALRPNLIEIHLADEDLRRLTTNDSVAEVSGLASIREKLAAETGVSLPRCTFCHSAHPVPGTVAFRVGHLLTNPITGLEDCGRDGIAVLTSALESCIRSNAHYFVDRESALDQLNETRLMFPVLVEMAEGRYSITQVAKVLRSLASERVPIRNIRTILERMADYGTIPAEIIGVSILSEPQSRIDAARLTEADRLTSFVRAGLKQELQHSYRSDGGPLRCHVIDADLEWLLINQQAESASISSAEDRNEISQRILDAKRRFETVAAPAARPVPILTSMELRPLVRDIIAVEFPGVPVLAYEELLVGIEVEPIGIIGGGEWATPL